MIRLEHKDGAIDAVVWSEPPTIYLDTWALDLFSSNDALRIQFVDRFAERGTLAISLMNVAEIGAHGAATRPALRSFLEAIDVRWLPLTIDPFKVMTAQETHDEPCSGCLSAGFLTDHDFSSALRTGNLTLVHIVDLTRGDPGGALKAVSDGWTGKLCQEINNWRSAYDVDPKTLDSAWPALPFNEKAPMRPIYNAFLRLCVKDRFPFNHNHGRDLYHAIASVGCVQMTLLDGHWAGQARKVQKLIGMPQDFVKIYSPGDVPQFLADFASLPPSRGLYDR
jgi:hypothetical protein